LKNAFEIVRIHGDDEALIVKAQVERTVVAHSDEICNDLSDEIEARSAR
jgi:hypothetical protein